MSKKDPIEELPSNSQSSRVAPIRNKRASKRVEEEGALIVEEPKRKRRAIRVQANQKKRTLTQSIASSLASEGTQNVVTYIVYDVLIPALKNLVQDSVTSGIEMMLFGETKGGRTRGRDKDRTVVSYGKFYRDRDRDANPYEPRRRPVGRDKFDLRSIFFKDHSDAEEVLDELCDRLEEYEEVTVADFFDLAGVDGATWAHHKYGWTNLKKAHNTHTRHGWAIELPDPVELD